MSKLWDVIELPVYVIIIWSIISVFLQAYGLLPAWLMSAIGFGIVIVAFGWIGYIMQGKGFWNTAKQGAVAGAIVGLVGALLGLFSYYFFPQVFTASIEQMSSSGVAADSINTYLLIGLYFGLLSGPIMNAAVGGLISGLSSMIRWQKR